MNVMKKNKLAGKFSLLHRLNTDTVIIGLLPGINVNELTSTDLRYLAAFYPAPNLVMQNIKRKRYKDV